MNADTFMNAIVMIDDRHLDIETNSSKITHHKWIKRTISAVAAAALISCPLPALTAFGHTTAYSMLYTISPSVAQTFKPVQKTCEDNGVEMTVISAERNGNEASVYLAMHDTTGTCPDGEWDLYDSYRLNVPKDMTGHCSFSEYDAENHTAYFVVHLETMDGSVMSNGKVTFSVNKILTGKLRYSCQIENIDMNNIPYEPQTQNIAETRGSCSYDGEKNEEDYRFLLPSEEPLFSPLIGISVENIGYIDGSLHILTKYKDIPNTDNHGFINLIDKNGNEIGDKTEIGFSYWDSEHTDSYTEQIIPVEYDLLKDCSLQGDFVASQGCISGDWEITFPLE